MSAEFTKSLEDLLASGRRTGSLEAVNAMLDLLEASIAHHRSLAHIERAKKVSQIGSRVVADSQAAVAALVTFRSAVVDLGQRLRAELGA